MSIPVEDSWAEINIYEHRHCDIGSDKSTKCLSMKVRNPNTKAVISKHRQQHAQCLISTRQQKFRFEVFVIEMSDHAAIAWWKSRFGDEIERHVDRHGTSEIDKFFKKKLDTWKDVKVNIAITGDAGAGKSSFINKLLG